MISVTEPTMPSLSSAPASGGRLVSVDGRTLPLRAVRLECRAGGGLARVIVSQTFTNPYTEPLDVSYLLPLPTDGAVSGFSFQLGDQRVIGEVDTREQVEERFREAVAAGKTAATLAQERTSLFTQRVGNLPAGATLVAETIIDQRLRWLSEGVWEWRFPTVVTPRYLGAQGRVPDADAVRVAVAADDIEARTDLSLEIADELTGRVEGASHAISFTEGPLTRVSATGLELDRDIVMRWPVATESVGTHLRCSRPSDHDRQYGLLTLSPPVAPTHSMPRDVLLLIDTSGSMAGVPLRQCKRVLRATIESLGPEDRLEMMEFSNRPRSFEHGPQSATDDLKRRALAWVRSLDAQGGTEMRTAVLEAIRSLREGAQRQIVLLTDGHVGFEVEVLRLLWSALPKNVRFHVVGVGSAPNRSLTEAASRAGRGVEVIVEPNEDAERGARRLLARLVSPLVTEVTLSGDALLGVAPTRAPDLYASSPALLSVALRPEGGMLRARGVTAAGPFERTIRVEPRGEPDEHVPEAALFARERVEDLEIERMLGGSGIDAQIESLGLRFQIATRRTSWIAVTKDATVELGQPKRSVVQPHALPYGTSMSGLGLRPERGAFIGHSRRRVMSRGGGGAERRPATRGRRRMRRHVRPEPRERPSFGPRRRVVITKPLPLRGLAKRLGVNPTDLLMHLVTLQMQGIHLNSVLDVQTAIRIVTSLGHVPVGMDLLLRVNAASKADLQVLVTALSYLPNVQIVATHIGAISKRDVEDALVNGASIAGLGVQIGERARAIARRGFIALHLFQGVEAIVDSVRGEIAARTEGD